MVGNGEYEDQNSSNASSFWECREYHRTVKRVDAAYKLCNELCLMIQERAELEKAYSSNLKKWSSRWLSFLDSGLEYGSGSSPWKGLCKEAEAVSNAHQNVRNILIDDIQTGVKQWQKEHFHKSSLPPQTLKETKQFEQDFELAQKQWSKRLKKVHTTKKEYYQACKTERSLQVQVRNAKSDPSGTAEQEDAKKLKKTQEKLAKAEKDVYRTRDAYKMALADLNTESSRYVEEMTKVFNRTQDFERERLSFFKDIFNSLHGALNVCAKVNYDSIYSELAESISQCDVEADLNLWSSNHGVDMPFVSPQFEEYSPDLAYITGKKRATLTDPDSPVTLTNITMISHPFDHESNEITSNNSRSNNNNHNKKSENTIVSSANGRNSDTNNPFDDKVSTNRKPTNGVNASVYAMSSGSAAAFAGDGDGGIDSMYTEEINDATYDDGREGVKVRALYDYVGQDGDEISFVAGDTFEKLEEPDDQGWCKGRKDGRVGLYPANYVELCSK